MPWESICNNLWNDIPFRRVKTEFGILHFIYHHQHDHSITIQPSSCRTLLASLRWQIIGLLMAWETIGFNQTLGSSIPSSRICFCAHICGRAYMGHKLSRLSCGIQIETELQEPSSTSVCVVVCVVVCRCCMLLSLSDVVVCGFVLLYVVVCYCCEVLCCWVVCCCMLLLCFWVIHKCSLHEVNNVETSWNKSLFGWKVNEWLLNEAKVTPAICSEYVCVAYQTDIETLEHLRTLFVEH